MNDSSTITDANSRPREHSLRRRHRLSNADDFSRVFNGQTRKHDGPLTVFALANALGHPRIGLSISKRKLGSAVKRNALKRRLREAFRVLPKDELGGYDYLVIAKPHAPLAIAEYQRILQRVTRRLRTQLDRRSSDTGRRDRNVLP